MKNAPTTVLDSAQGRSVSFAWNDEDYPPAPAARKAEGTLKVLTSVAFKTPFSVL
jgi:hypothetical protein